MRDLSLHLLDMIENSVRAGATRIRVERRRRRAADSLRDHRRGRRPRSAGDAAARRSIPSTRPRKARRPASA